MQDMAKFSQTTWGCGLRQIMRNPKIPNHEIMGAQHHNNHPLLPHLEITVN